MVLFKQILFGLFLTALFIGIGYGIWYGSRLDTLTIKKIEVDGGETVSNEAVKKLAERELEGEYFRLVPKRFAWTYPKEKIEHAISDIPRVREVNLAVKDGEKLEISFTEYHPYALWCATNAAGDCVFIEETGYAFADAPALSGGAFLRYADRQRSPEVGVAGFSDDFIKDSITVIQYLEQKQFEVSLVLRVNEDESEYIFAEGGSIKISSRLSVEDTLENLETILTSKEFAHLRPGNFQYIDLRYGNKVFVNEESLTTNEGIENENAADLGSAATE